jgi:hypothetical protein
MGARREIAGRMRWADQANGSRLDHLRALALDLDLDLLAGQGTGDHPGPAVEVCDAAAPSSQA